MFIELNGGSVMNVASTPIQVTVPDSILAKTVCPFCMIAIQPL
jgi:hypothetical protein